MRKFLIDVKNIFSRDVSSTVFRKQFKRNCSPFLLIISNRSSSTASSVQELCPSGGGNP
ncbi:hypothetical protein ACIQ9R_23135 [Streptomyces sp. NPDC094447]|uniref:hypothetical protein n=1 Tax=Streptomyces sp. NPDC094447 TaxID=3366062 RepID=UPI00382F4E3C